MGIPASHIKEIFEPFHPIYKTGLGGEESVGLGLTLVKIFFDPENLVDPINRFL